MTSYQRSSGFALLSALWLCAIIALLALSLMRGFRHNTEAVQIESSRTQHQQLHQSGVRYAALYLASKRTQVAVAGTPSNRLKLTLGHAVVEITIDNEAGRLDLIRLPSEALQSILRHTGLSANESGELVRRIKKNASDPAQMSYRTLRRILSDHPGLYTRLRPHVSLHNGQAGVNPVIASVEVLSLLPGLAAADREQLLAQRKHPESNLISTPVSNELLTNRLSSHYRITTRTQINGAEQVHTDIIQMTNEPGTLYRRRASL